MNSEERKGLQNTDDRQRGIKGRKAFITGFSWISLVECKHKTATWAGVRECCFSSVQVQLFWCVCPIRLLSRGPEPAAVCLGMSRAKPTGLAGYSHPTGELIWIAGKNNAPWRHPSVSSRKPKYIFMEHLCSLSRQMPIGKATNRTLMSYYHYSIWQFWLCDFGLTQTKVNYRERHVVKSLVINP